MNGPTSTEEAVRVIEKFDTLTFEKRWQVFKSLSSLARAQLLEVVASPGELLRNISEEEMFFMIKQTAGETGLNLLALTTGRQLRYLLDLELWKNDMFDPVAADRWVEILTRIGRDKTLQFVQVTDPELLVTTLHSLVEVQVRNPDVDLAEQMDYLPPFTLDEQFFVKFRRGGTEDAVRSLLETIFDWDDEFYFFLMRELSTGVTTEAQEMASKWRRARLSDHGFPEFDESLMVYQYIPHQELKETPDDTRSDSSGGIEESGGYQDYALSVIREDNFLKQSLALIHDETEMDRIAVELAHLANKVIVADGRDPGSGDDLQRSLRKVSGYINMALEEMCSGNIEQAAGMLKANHMEILFRRGFSLILDLRKDAQKLLRDYVGGVENLGHPLAGLLNGLLQKRPVYAENVFGAVKSREFEYLEDIRYIKSLLDPASIEDNWEPV